MSRSPSPQARAPARTPLSRESEGLAHRGTEALGDLRGQGQEGQGQGHAHGHHHTHHHTHLEGLGLGALLGTLALNLAYTIVELVGGLLTGSLALLSDAAHMFSDVASLAVAAAAAWLGQSAARGRYTFGLGRLPVLGGLVNALTAMGLGVLIVLEALERLRAPPPVSGGAVLAIATLGLLVNLASALWLHKRGGHGVNSRGAMLHMVADALGSLAAMASGLVLLTTGWRLIDPALSVLVAGIVLASALPLLRDVATILLQGAPAGLDLKAVEDSILTLGEVREVVGLHAWELDSGEAVTSLVLVTGERDLPTLCCAADQLRDTLAERFGLRHVTIEWRDLERREPCCASPAARQRRPGGTADAPVHGP